jgi:hypothetical protein
VAALATFSVAIVMVVLASRLLSAPTSDAGLIDASQATRILYHGRLITAAQFNALPTKPRATLYTPDSVAHGYVLGFDTDAEMSAWIQAHPEAVKQSSAGPNS